MFYFAHKTGILVLLMAVLAGLFGCRLRPQLPEPRAEAELPPLPEVLNQRPGQEPQLKVYMHETGFIQEMSFEEYISGVVAAEMKPEWHEEALAAQAIIARSFTLQKIKEKGGVPERGAHASTDIEEFQAYDAGRINDNVRRAVEKTRGRVAIYQGSYIRGWFHAFAGPRTAKADEGLDFEGGNPPYIQIVDSPGREIVPVEEGYWSASFSQTQIREAAREITGTDPGPVEKVEISEKGPSGRATKIRINELDISANSLRLQLGSTVMRSTFIDQILLADDNSLSFNGSGYGHGVGMCQWGARALAEKGWPYQDIIKYFYKDIEIVDVW